MGNTKNSQCLEIGFFTFIAPLGIWYSSEKKKQTGS